MATQTQRTAFCPVRVELLLSENQALALAQMVKRICHEDLQRLSSRFDRYDDGRMELDHMLNGVARLQRALAEVGFEPR